MKKKLLISGGAYGDIPLIKSAKELGFHVITTGNRPDELGHQYSDEYIAADYSDKEALLKLAMDNEIDNICSSCSDISAVSSAYVAEKLELPGHDRYDIALIMHNKDLFRRLCLENNISSPMAVSYNNLESALKSTDTPPFPIIVKPVDMTGGQGVVRVDNSENLESALTNAFNSSKSKRVVVEEFLEGSYHGCSTFIISGKVVFCYTDDEYYFDTNKYRVGATSTPSIVPPSAIESIKLQIEKIASLLNLSDGIFHLQFILKGGIPFFMDLCRRLPGDLYPIIVKYATGVDYSSIAVKLFTGLPCSKIETSNSLGYFGRTNILCHNRGIFRSLTIDSSIKENLLEQHMWVKPGDRIENIDMPKFGIAFFKFKSMDEMAKKMNKISDLISINVS